tara:strand:- start:893 stop:1651 length:759 start_codon:yes stop_codon:yes gene_type:complete
MVVMKKRIPNNLRWSCKGINNAIALLTSNRFSILGIDILKNGNAHKDYRIKSLLNDYSPSYLEKKEFNQKYPEGRSQGIIVRFSGKLSESIFPNFNNRINVCLLALDQIEDPQNFGQIIRTAECAGIDGIIYPKHNSVTITQTVMQVSQGAFVNIPLYEITNLSQGIQELKKKDFWVIGIENSINAKPWYKIQYKEKIVIILGSESKGMRKKTLQACDFLATIPMQGQTNSLNVSAAGSAILFERLRQLGNG